MSKLLSNLTLSLLILAPKNVQAETLNFACMDTWRGYLSAKSREPDEAVIQDSSSYHPKTFRFEFNVNSVVGVRDNWESYSCKRHETLDRELLDCINEHNNRVVQLDISNGVLVEWMLLSGNDWSSSVMSRGKCEQTGR